MGKLNYSSSDFVISVTPLKGYLLDEFSDSEELQSQFHEVDLSLKTLEAL
jgi:hypothetical protein